jgi:hypothetical protein
MKIVAAIQRIMHGAKALYADLLAPVESRLRPGSLVLADDARYCAEFVSKLRAAADIYVSVPLEAIWKWRCGCNKEQASVRSAANARLIGDIVEARGGAVAREDLFRDLKDALAVALGIGARLAGGRR